MHPDYTELIERRFRVGLPEKGPDKRVSLADAIARFTRPGMSLHLASTHTRPYCLVRELIRQYWQKDAGLELSCLNLGEGWVALYVGGIMRRAITTFAGDVWPYPSPNPVINDAWLSGRVAIEHWSILSLTQRLLAGALRLPFMPTQSIVGSSMADNEAFREIDDPFGGGERIGVVGALRPDVCFVHSPACDVSGNAILTPPLGEGAVGAFAAKDGVVVSTERVVSTEYLRAHNHLVRIPGHLVRAVVELPLGGHPRGQTNVGLPDAEQYADDYAYLFESRQAARRGPDELARWIEHWFLSCETHQDFLDKLGAERIARLKSKAKADAWYPEILGAAEGAEGDNARPAELSDDTERFLASEMMVVAAARAMADVAEKESLTSILAGIGAANLAAWVALHRLRDRGHPIEAMAEVGYFGYEPRPADPYVFNFKNTPTCVAATDVLTVLGMVVGGDANLGSLGAAQIDRYGNVNSTCVPGKMHLVGSGGGNDVASGSKVVVVTAYLGSDKFRESLPYVTSPGRNVRVVATDYGVLEKADADAELELTAYYVSGPTGFADPAAAVRAIRERVGWDLKVREPLRAIEAPSREELLLARLHDPYRQFLR